MLLEGKRALVTGASRGIGRAVAQALAREGAEVIGTATTPDGAQGITAALDAVCAGGTGRVLDVSRARSIEGLGAEIAGSMPDILVNNAGITRDGLLLRMKEEDWDAVIETDLGGVFRLTRLCLREMVRRRWGRIVSISSVVAASGNPGQANYCAAKAGVEGFTRALAREVAQRGVTVNAVAPGFIDTDMTRALSEAQREALAAQIPAARLGSPEDVAGAVVYLASDAAAYVTGQVLHVNGGMYCGG